MSNKTRIICTYAFYYGMGRTYQEAYDKLICLYGEGPNVGDCSFFENCTRVEVAEERKIIKKEVTIINKKEANANV